MILLIDVEYGIVAKDSSNCLDQTTLLDPDNCPDVTGFRTYEIPYNLIAYQEIWFINLKLSSSRSQLPFDDIQQLKRPKLVQSFEHIVQLHIMPHFEAEEALCEVMRGV